MDGDDQEVIYCENDGVYEVYCEICDKFCIERFYENHLQLQTHTNNNRKRQQLK